MQSFRNIQTVAVTGTNGKTSTVELAWQLLSFVGRHPASLGTLGLHVVDMDYYDPIMIGADAMPDLAGELIEDYHADTFIFEAYSAAITGKLYDKLPVDIAVLTNIGEDHIEYHGSKENYVNAKMRLFRELLQENGIAIFNAGDERFQKIKNICEQRSIKTFTFGLNRKADLYITGIRTDFDRSEGTLTFLEKEYNFSVPVIGDVFLLNWLASLSISLQFNIPLKRLLEYSESVKLPPGRLEYVGSYNRARIYVDYAHTADALKAVLMTLGRVTKGKLHLLFGCGGGRDIFKRSQMGKVARNYADNVYVTDDNPREENPETIRRQILEFCPDGIEIEDRKVAIKQAIRNLKEKDTLIIAGKGHETYQEIKGETRHFSDKEIVNNYLKESASKYNKYVLQLS